MHVRFIQPESTHELRQLVLRPAQGIDEMNWSLDHAEDSFHLGALIGKRCIAVATFMPQRNEQLRGWKQYRLRGMATHPDHQGKGYGHQLLRFGLDHLQQQSVDLVWCNARAGAVRFYAKAAFVPVQEPFNIHGIGIHQLMCLRF